MNLIIPLFVFGILATFCLDDMWLMLCVFVVSCICGWKAKQWIPAYGVFLMFLLFLFAWVQHSAKITWKKWAHYNIVILLTGILLLSFCSLLLLNQNGATTNFRKTVHDGIDRIRYGDAMKNRISVKVEGASDSPIYIAKEYYANLISGEEIALDETSIDEKYTEMELYFKEQKFYPISQIQQFLELSNELDERFAYKQYQMNIQVLDGNRKILLLPVSTTLSTAEKEIKKLNGQDYYASKGLFGTNKYEISAVAIDCKELLDVQTEWLETSDTTTKIIADSLRSYSRCESIYRNFSYDNYLDIPQEKELLLQTQELDGVGGTNLCEVSESIAGYLDSKKELKYASEYAEEALYLFRYANVPARITKGYILYSDEIENGREVKLDTSVETFWVEIYVNGVGFVPADITKSAVSSTDTTDYVKINSSYKTDTESHSKTKKRNVWIHAIKVLFIGIFIGLWSFLLFSFLYRRIRIWNDRIWSRDDKEFVRFLCLDLEKMIKCSKLDVDMHYPQEISYWMKIHYGMEMYQYSLLYFQRIDCVLFNEECLTNLQREELLHLQYKMALMMRQKNSRSENLKLWYRSNITKRWGTQDEKKD